MKKHAAEAPKPASKLGFFALIAIVVGSMLGGGVYSLPQNTSLHSAVGPIIIAWLIAGFGVYFIANSFRILSDIRPDLKSGVYMYAREGFGPFIGFVVAWGYWLMTAFGNVAFAVILMDAMNYIFPGKFTGGNNLNSIIFGSILIWLYYFLVLRGIKTASFINMVGTMSNLIPLTLFIIIMLFFFKFSHFTENFWGHSAPAPSEDLGSIPKQIMSPMLVALWCFIGVEGAVVLSGRAKNPADVGKATLIGFLVVLTIYILLSILPFGFMAQHEIAEVPNPSTAGVLGKAVGNWGQWLMNIGLMISVLVGWLSWTLLCAEVPMAAAQNGTFPSLFAKQNKNQTPSFSLLVSSIIMQAAMLLIYFSNNAWQTMLSISSLIMLPAYLGTTLFLFKLCTQKEYEKYAKKGKTLAYLSGLIGFLFGLFMFYAGGIQYVVMVPVLLALGVPVFIWSRWEKRDGAPIFQKVEVLYLLILLLLAIAGIISVWGGWVKL